jgi:hypothetical protein
LPRAIEEDGLRVTPLLETPQMRVLQVSVGTGRRPSIGRINQLRHG